MSRALVGLSGLAGLALLVALVVASGVDDLAALLASAGWGLLWLVPFHALPIALDALGWRALLAPVDPARRAGIVFLWWVASIREAINRLLPAGGVGGEVVGIRLALWRLPNGAAVTATVVAEVLLTLVNTDLFIALGLAIALLLDGDRLALALLAGVAVTLPLPVLLYALLRHGALFGRIERAVIGLLGEQSRIAALFGDAAVLDAELRRLMANHRALLAALGWQFAGMVVGAFEVWLGLRLLGHPVSPWAAIALEASGQAVRHFAFFVPAGLGVQEAGFLLFGRLLGVPGEAALALSLARRLRELGYGLPALASWHWAEARRVLAGLPERADIPVRPD